MNLSGIVTHPPRVTVVGVGADGWDGLSLPAQEEITSAEILLGSARHLSMLPPGSGERRVWPSPLLPALESLLAENAHRRICVLASGDPMFYGIGATLVRLLGTPRVRVLPHLSSATLACARLGWSWKDTEVVTVVGRPLASVRRHLAPGRRLLVLSEGAHTPGGLAILLREAGFADSRMILLEELGGEAESRREATAGQWRLESVNPLNIVAVECSRHPAGPAYSTLAGLPDDAYEHDGQITKREIRAPALALLGPRPGEMLWDVGAGAGSVAIEWARSHPSCRAVAVERDPGRAEAIGRNIERLGVPHVAVVRGEAIQVLDDQDPPDAVFLGGGTSDPRLITLCRQALPQGGRLVAHAVTLESEQTLVDQWRQHGGDLSRLAVQRAQSIGTFHTLRPALPVTQWSWTKL